MFRRLLGLYVFSGLGGGIFQIFMLLSIHLLYENPIYTGIAGALIAAPHIFSFAVGPLADRRNKVSIIRVTLILEFIPLALLAFTPLLETIGIMFMFAVIIAYSIARLFEGPASNALLPQIVSEDDLMKANSLTQIVVMSSGLVIALALFVIMGANDDMFAVDAFTVIYGASAGFLVVAFLFSLLLKDPSAGQGNKLKEKINYLHDLRQGGKFIMGNVLLFFVVVVVMTNFVGQIAYVNRPEFLEYHAGAQGYIFLITLALVGGIFASVLTGALGGRLKIGPMVFIVLFALGVIRILFTLILPYNFAVAVGLMIVVGIVGTTFGIAINSLMQRITPKDMIGRVGSVFATSTSVVTVLGALVGGFLGNIVSQVDYIFLFQGASYIAMGIFIILIPKVRKLPKINEIKSPNEVSVTGDSQAD